MRRRDFIALIGGVGAASWPFAVAAQQLTLPVIGFLHSASADPTAKLVKGFCKGLFDLGFVEDQNVRIDFRWADGQNDRLPELAADLIRPALVNPTYVSRQALVKNMQAGAVALGLQLEVLNASTDDEIENAFKVVAQRPGTPLIVGPDPFYTSRRSKIASLQVRYAGPTMYDVREFAEAGGLISYGPDLTNAYREAGTYSGRILKGEKPAEMPVALSTKFELVINAKTVKSLGIAVPDRLLALADEVI